MLGKGGSCSVVGTSGRVGLVVRKSGRLRAFQEKGAKKNKGDKGKSGWNSGKKFTEAAEKVQNNCGYFE